MAIINHNSISGINTISVGSSIVIGDNFVLNTNGIENVNGLNISGVVTASSFVGDGSSLTGIDATALKDPDGNVIIQAEASGINVTGVSTFSDEVYFGASAKATSGGGNFTLEGNIGNSAGTYLRGATVYIGANGGSGSYSNTVVVREASGNQLVELAYAGSTKLATTAGGIDVTGHAELDNVNIAGVLTATSAEFTGNVTVLGDLTYENVTSLDSIGVATARSGLRITGGGLDVVGVATFNDNVKLLDSDKLLLGDGDDLQIYHNGSSSYINNGGGSNGLFIRSTDTFITNTDATKTSIRARPNDYTALYYDGSERLKTTGYGVTITGTTETQQLSISGVSTFISGGNGEIIIYEVSGNPRIEKTGGGSLNIRANNNTDITVGSNYSGRFGAGGGVSLFHSGIQKFGTTTDGINIVGTTETDQLNVTGVSTFSGSVNLGDDDSINLGDSSEFRIYHTTSGNSIISETGSGSLYLDAADLNLRNGTATGENYITCVSNGAVSLYYDNSKKLETTTGGINVTGSVTCDGLSVVGATSLRSDSASTSDVADFYNGTSGGHTRLKIRTYANGGGDPFIFFDAGGSNMVVGNYWQGTTNNLLRLGAGDSVSSVSGMEINGSGHCAPTADNSYDMGTSSKRWRNIYSADLQLSNEGSSNDVDGTWGQYTIQEGEHDLFLINRRSGKKYAFVLREVD